MVARQLLAPCTLVLRTFEGFNFRTGCKYCKTDISLVVAEKRQEEDSSSLQPLLDEECISILSDMEPEMIVNLLHTLDIQPHSETDESHEVLSMIESTPEQVVDIPSEMDPTRSFADKSDNSLGEFLSRPLKIADFGWTPSTTFFETFNPWRLFIENKRNINRINNYRMFRAKLKVKFLINGNSFFYGRLMACYQPLSTFDAMTTNVGLTTEDNTQMSQFPRIFIDPTTSQGGEMTLPFMWHWDYCDLVGEDYINLGQMTIRELTGLKHTSGDVTLSNKLNITVYAWMEDLQLEAPTSANIGSIVPQSQKGKKLPKKDERDAGADGPVQKAASAVEAAASALSAVPAIAPFAAPAAIGAGVVKGIASRMGWSSPTLTEAPAPYKPTAVCNTAVTNGADSSQKLTIDGKAELSVDPRIVGLGSTDELELKYIASRESYLTSFDWNLTTSSETLLWNCRVDPCVINRADRKSVV